MTWDKARKLPAMLYKFAPRIADYSDERESQNGIWVFYEPRWKSHTDALGCQHQDHEDTVKELYTKVRYALRCDCQECLELSK